MDAVGASLLVVLIVIVGAAGIAGFVFWILKIVEVARIPGYQFQAAGTDQLPWVLVVVLAGIVGALIWQLAKRNDVLAAVGWLPRAPPGWYPEPGGVRAPLVGRRPLDRAPPPPAGPGMSPRSRG